MRYSSQVYQHVVEQFIDKYGDQAFVGFQSDMATLNKNVENIYNERSLESFTLGLSDALDRDYEKIKNDNTINYVMKFLDFQHFYVAFKSLESKYASMELEESLNKLRHKLDGFCEVMAKRLENFSLQ